MGGGQADAASSYSSDDSDSGSDSGVAEYANANGSVSDNEADGEQNGDAAFGFDGQNGINAVSNEPTTVASREYTVTAGKTVDLKGNTGYDHSWESSDTDVATVVDTSEWSSRYSESIGTATVTGVKAGTAKITHTSYYRSGWSTVKETETFTVTVEAAKPATSITISGDDEVMQFSTTTLTATLAPSDASGVISWSSDDDEILTVSDKGVVTGVRQGTANVTASVTNSDGTVVSDSKQMTVVASTKSTDKANVYYLVDPTKDANSNDTGNWGGPLSGTATVNTDGATWVDNKNCFDNVDQRVISWPNGTNVVTRGSDAWNEIFKNYKSTIQEQLPGIDFTEDDVEEISLVPAKISRNNGTNPDKHLDCNVSIKCKNVALAKYYVRDAGSTLFKFVGSKNYRIGDGTQPSDVTTETFPETKVVDGVTYTFSGWYLDADFTTPVTFPYKLNSSQTFYAKYKSGAMTVSGTDYSGAYDGQAHGEAAVPSVTEGTTVEYSVDDGKTWSTDVPKVTNVSDSKTVKVRATNPNYTTAYTTYTLEVTKRPVTFTGNSDSKAYNGSEQTVTGFTTDDGEATGLVAGQTSNVEASASRTLPGTTTGTITGADDVVIKAAGGSDVTANYSVETKPGKMTITGVEGTIVVTAADDSKVYDGTALTNGGYTYTDGVLLEGDVLTAQVSGSATNVGDEGKNSVVSYKVMRGDLDVTSAYTFGDSVDGTLSIKKRPVTFTGNSDSKAYNGSEQTVTGFTTDDGEATGLVAGQTSNVEASASRTLPGTTTGTITGADDVVIKAAGGSDVTANYSVETKPGKMTITGVEGTIVVTAADDSKVYDGTALTNGGYTYTDGVLLEGDVLTAQVSGSATNVGDEGKNSVVSYKVMRGDLDVTSAYTFGDSVDGTLSIKKRPVTLTSESGSKVYDGTALTKSDVAVGGLGFVEGEVTNVVATGSVTKVSEGKVTNAIEYTPGTKFKESNYSISKDEGQLWITEQSINPKDPDAYMGVEIGTLPDVVYNGYTQEQKPTVTGKDGNDLVEGTDYTVSFSDDVKNVGMVTVTITGIGNYTGTVTRTYQITPAPLHINTGSATKVYNGEPLTNSEMTVTGLVGDDTLTGLTTGSQTEVGSSPNTYELKGGTADLANYTVTEELGTLTVTEAPAPEADTPADDNKSVMAKTGDAIPMAAVVAVAAVAMIALAGAVVAARRRKN